MAAVADLDVEHAPKYRKRDVTGDGKPETFCNVYVEDLLERLGLLIPKGRLAHYQLYWFESAAGRAMGWERCEAHRAIIHAEHGLPCVVGWLNPDGHSHIALLVPTPDGAEGIHITQAGASNYACTKLRTGFPKKLLHYFFHA